MSINIQTFRKKIKICRFAATVDVLRQSESDCQLSFFTSSTGGLIFHRRCDQSQSSG